MSTPRSLIIGIILCVGLLLPGGHALSQAMEVVPGPLVGQGQIQGFQNLIALSLMFVLGLLMVLSQGEGRPIDESEADTPGVSPLARWLAGSTGIFIALIVTLDVLVNPRGYYPTSLVPPRLELLRPVKDTHYQSLSRTPEVIILGSSHALSLSPSHLEKETGLRTFNWAVEAATPQDYNLELRFNLDLREKEVPQVMLVEVMEPLYVSRQVIAERTSSVLLPYLDPQTRIMHLWIRFRSLFEGSQAAESLYVLRYWQHFGWLPEHSEYDQNGEALNPRWGVESVEIRLARVKESIANPPLVAASRCTQLEVDGMQELEELVTRAEQNGIAIVFFSSPRQPEFYASISRQEEFLHCHEVMVEFMKQLQQEHDGVEYVDFSDTASFNGLGDEFWDADHMTVKNGMLMLDALAPVVERAYLSSASRLR